VARVPDAEIERLKAEVPLASLAEAAGVELRRTGADLTGRCPFHADDTPSLVISPDKNLWHCMGACQAGGSVIDWVMRAEGVSFRHAVELLRDGLPAAAGAGPKRSTVRRLASPVERAAADHELLGQVADYYHRVLLESPDVLGYLARRRIDHPEALEVFRLGYADRTLGLRLPDKRRRDGAELRGRLEALGIFRASGHEHLVGSLVIPVFDEHGNVAEVYGRKVRDDLRAGTPRHLYLPGPHRGVWNLPALAASDEVIVTESLIDALSFWCAGFRHVTACYGAGGFTADHERAFEQHGVRRVLIAFDRDDAGDRAARELAGQLTVRGVECFWIEFPAGADANDLAVGSKSPAEALGRAIRSAAWMGAGPGPARRRDAPLPEPPAVPSLPSLPRPGRRWPIPSRLGRGRSRPPRFWPMSRCRRWPAGRRRGGSGSAAGGSGAWTRRRASTRCGSTSCARPLTITAGPGSTSTRSICIRRGPGPGSSPRPPPSWAPSRR